MSISPKGKALFKERAQALKSAGISNFDLRRNPTEYEKRKARELYKRFESVIQHPEKFKKIIVDNSTARKIDISPLKQRTGTGKKTAIFVESKGKKVKVNRNKSITIGERGKDQIIHTYYVGGKGIFETAKKVFSKLPDYDQMVDDGKIDDKISEVKKYVTVAIGENNPFLRAMYSEAEFNFYIQEFKPHDAKGKSAAETQALKDKLIQRMVTVEVYSPDGFEGEADKSARDNALRIYKGKTSATQKAANKNSRN